MNGYPGRVETSIMDGCKTVVLDLGRYCTDSDSTIILLTLSCKSLSCQLPAPFLHPSGTCYEVAIRATSTVSGGAVGGPSAARMRGKAA